MNASALLIVLLANQGYWLGDTQGDITLRWAAEGGPPPAVVAWELYFGQVSLAKGEAAIEANGKQTVVRLSTPTVRVRTSLRWQYRVMTKDGKQELAAGEAAIEVFPSDMQSALARRLEGRTLMVLDPAGDLAKALVDWHVPAKVVTRPSDLQLAHTDIILVAPDALVDSPFAQSPLLDQATAGASVFIFRQSRVRRIMGYDLVRRQPPERMQWRLDHPLVNRLSQSDLQSWLAGTDELLSVQLPADEPALEIAHWPIDPRGPQPGPIEAMLLSKRVGNGRIVICQIPLGPWQRDPRSQLFLGNVVDYFLTRPEPTPRPSERLTAPVTATQPVPTVTIPGGVKP